MKTKLTTIFKKSANTPPMWVCLLFALVISTNCWGSVVSFGQSSSGAATTLPANNTSTDPLNGVTLTNSGVGIGSWSTTYYMEFGNDDAYLDITLSEGYKLSSIDAGIYYDGSGEGKLNIKYATSLQYNETYKINNSETPINLSNTDFYSYPANATNIGSVPEGAKSARIYKTGTRQYGIKLLRLVVTTAVDLSIKDDAELALAVTEKSIPVGGTFNIGVSTADGYDGEISYSVSPSGVVNLNEGTGVVTGTAMGEATISVTASTTENYIGSTERCTVHVIKNFAGTLTASEDAGTVSLNWFYNLPISLETPGNIITRGSATSSSSYADGIRTVTYSITAEGGKSFHCVDFKTPDGSHTTPNCKSFSFEYKGDGNNGTNPRVVPYSWVSGAANGDIVADKVDILDTWQEATVTPAYYFNDANVNMKGSGMDYNYYTYPSGCVAFFAMSDGTVSSGTLQLRNAYYQIINTNGLTSSVKLVRKDGSAPANASDGVVRYAGDPTTYEDNSGLVAGHTYYYRLFVTYNDVEYASNAVSITMPGTAKEDPELSLPESSALLMVGDTYTLEPTVASGYNGTLAYEITSGSDKISLSGSTITAEAAGTATVRVTAPETTEYNQVTANFTVTVLAVPETNLAITNVDGDNVTLTWDVPGKIDLSKASLSNSDLDYFIINQKPADEFSYNSSSEELTVTYHSAVQWAQLGVAFPFNLSDLEHITYEYNGRWVFPAVVLSDGATLYWENASVESSNSWKKVTKTPNKNYSSEVSDYPLSEAKAITFCANPNVAISEDESFYLRNVFYHCTGMTDIDHIVIMRTTSVAATDTVSGTKIYSGKMSHFVDTDSKAAGLYYYTIFAVYEDACFPVEYVTLDNRSFSITYKDKGDAEFSGTHETGYPTTHSNAAATALKKATKENYAFVGWYDNAACTGDAITSLAAGAYNADITLYARWEQLSLHEPGKYQAPDGYGRVLKNVNGHDYEVYLVTYDEAGRECESGCDNKNGELYAGPVDAIHDGYRLFTGSGNTEAKSADGWVAFKPYKYYGDAASSNYDEFQKLNANSSISSSRYARIGEGYYVRLYVQGYDQFAFVGQDNSADNHFVIRIDGIQQAYTPDKDHTNVTRFDLTTNEPHFIEITGSTSNTNSKFRGFSLRLPDVERYTVTVAKNDNSYGTVSAASIANVRTGEATYVTDNTLYIAGTTVTATPAENTAQYTYAFDNWSGVPATITEATTVTANFTRTGNDYTLTWDLNGGTITTAGTGAEMDATGTPSTTVAFGTDITVPVVAKEGSEFIGWDATPAATMPAENITYTAQWATPTVIGSGTTTMDYSNVYLPTAPATYEMNVDGVEGDETCLDIKGQGQADWWVKMTPASYRVSVKYGTPSGCVKVRVQIIDAETGSLIAETAKDEHCSGTVFMAAWAMDLSELINADKTYYIRVKDAYENTGSKPKVGIVEITPIEPLPITTAATKRLDYDNVAVPYQIMPFDIENDGVNETCLFIGNQHPADWRVTIVPDVYNIKIRYGKPDAGTNLTLYLLNEDGGEVWTSAARTTPSGRYETWEIKGVDLTNKVNKDKVYTIRIKDTYGSDGSKPYIEYIDVIPAVVRIPSETRLDATNTYSSVDIKTDVNFDDDDLTTDNSMNLNGTQADYVVQIQPGYYNVSLAYGAPEYNVKVAVTLTDPSGEKSEIYLSTNPYYSESGSAGVQHHHISSTKCDLTDLDGNKTYRLHITDQYGTPNKLRVSHLVFTPIEPVLISNGTILNSGNTVTFNAPTEEFNVDGEDGNETCLLVSQHYGVSPVEWSVHVTPGVYDLNVHFGNNAASDGGYDMTIYLVDPEAPETPVTLYHKRVSDGTSLSYGVARCDFSSLTADKDYIIRVVDNWNGSKLRVGDIKFVTPDPLQIPTMTRLDASNVYVLPTYGKQNFNIEGEGEIECLNIRYQGEAAWFANMTPYVYNITLKYGKPSAGVKVLFGIIDVETGETVYSQQFVDYTEGAITYTQNFNADLTDKISADKLYKLFIKDNHGSDGSEPRVAYIDITRYTITYTRTGLTVGNYGTICLPYAVAAEDIHGADIFDMQGWPAGSVAVVLNEVDNMEAGRPYVIQAKATTATWSYYPEGDPTDAGTHNGLIGSYTKEVITPNDNNYIVYDNKLYFVDVLAYVGINKAYINRTLAEEAAEPVAPAPGKRQIRLFLNGEQVVTDIDQINDQMTNTKYMENGILYILREGKVYNAQGQLVK